MCGNRSSDGCDPLLELLILLAILGGFLGMLLRRNLLLKVLSMDVMGSAVVALFVLVATRTGLQPILSTNETAVSLAAIADPIPQGVILTAIVIGISIQALLLVVISRLAIIDPVLMWPASKAMPISRDTAMSEGLSHALLVGWLEAPFAVAFSGAVVPILGEWPLLMCCIATGEIALQTLLSDSTTTLMLLGNHGVVLQLDPRRLVSAAQRRGDGRRAPELRGNGERPALCCRPCCSVASTSASW